MQVREQSRFWEHGLGSDTKTLFCGNSGHVSGVILGCSGSNSQAQSFNDSGVHNYTQGMVLCCWLSPQPLSSKTTFMQDRVAVWLIDIPHSRTTVFFESKGFSHCLRHSMELVVGSASRQGQGFVLFLASSKPMRVHEATFKPTIHRNYDIL
jgi:hypothetical protein